MSEENLQSEAKRNLDVPGSVSERPSRKMDEFHCDMLELSFEFAREDLDEPAFLKAVSELEVDGYTDDDGNIDIALSFGSRDKPPKPHAHLIVRLNKESKSRAELRFHNSTMEMEEDQPPYVDECVQWFSGFFKSDTIAAHVHVAYIFGESFSPTVTLPFPLVTSEKGLAGSLVMGISFLLPKGQLVTTATIQITPKGGTYLYITITDATNLKDFNLFAELERLSPSVNTLVKRKDANGEKGETQKDE
jgi:hypothetical protein